MSLCFSSYLSMALLLCPLHTIRRVHLYPNTTMLALATLRGQHFHICLNLHCYSTPTYSLDALLLVMDAEYFIASSEVLSMSENAASAVFTILDT